MHNALACVLLAAAVLGSSGCVGFGGWRWPRRPPPCALHPGATKQEIVAHVNRNLSPPAGAPPLAAWRCTDAKARFNGMPAVNASLEVEAPQRLRIRAQMPFTYSPVADFGSNDEEVWLWDQTAPGILTIPHENLPLALSSMQVPFDPDWLMEVLGVEPIDAGEFELVTPEPARKWVELVAKRQSPTGETVLRIMRVDLCQGRIEEHRIETPDGRVVAAARLLDYKPDATGQYVLPHSVQISWPATNSSIALTLRDIMANPPPTSMASWTVPVKPGVPRLEFNAPAAAPHTSREVMPAGNEQHPLDPPARVRLPDFSEDVPPAAYFPAASQSSWDQLPPEQASAPRPFPGRN
jgi:hypothetical protein